MARYTIELKDIVAAGHTIFDFRYPFYDENQRHAFEEKFIKHFFFREIGCETIDRFKFYLQDKMNTVFPYYNELFKAAQIEYSVLDNYKLTEEFTHTRENKGKTSGVSSNVSQLFADRESEQTQDRVVDTTGSVDTVGVDTEKTSSESTTAETTHSETNSKESTAGTTGSTSETTGTHSKNTTGSQSETSESIRKFLDTPQGRVDLSNPDYLTTLNHDNNTSQKSSEGSETGTDSQSVTNTGTNANETTGNSETDGTRNTTTGTSSEGERNSNVNQETTAKETSNDKLIATGHDEQKATQDNNTRTTMDNNMVEKHTLIRYGNIGVDTDSDMIEKHIRLQKTLRNIERMFFDDCEDLFMLVY